MTSLPRLLTALARRRPAACPPPPTPRPRWRPASPTTPRCSTSPATPRRPPRWRRGPRLGIDDVRIFVQWQAIAPGNSRGQGARRLQLGRSGQPGLQLVARGPGRGPGQRRRACARCSWSPARPAVGLAGARAPQRPLQAAPRPLRPVRARRGAALRPARSTAGSSGTSPTCRCGCSRRTRARAGAARPYAPHLYRRLVRAAYPAIKAVDPTSTVLFGALAPRGENADQAERPHAPAGLHPLDGLRQGDAQARSQRPVQGLQAADRRRPRLPPPRHHARARRAAAAILDDASIADLPRLERTLDAHPARRRPEKPGGGKFGLYFTEWGYQTARPTRSGRVAGQAVALPAAGRLHRLQGPAREAADPVRVARRAARPRHRGDQVLGLAVGPALRQRQGQAVAEELRQPVLHRPAPGQPHGPPVGPGAPGQRRTASPCSAASAGAKRWTTVKVLSTNAAGFWKLTPDGEATTDYRFTWQPDRPLRRAAAAP